MKKYITFIIAIIISLLVPVTVFAEEYGNEIPSYFNISGGSYIEVQTNVGRGVLLFQDSYKKNAFTFIGSNYQLFNASNSTMTGRLYMQNGTEYQARLSAYSSTQYYNPNESATTRQWRDLTITNIYNTNVEFTDNIGDRGNTIELFDVFQWSMFGLIGFLIVLFLLLILKLRGAL